MVDGKKIIDKCDVVGASLARLHIEGVTNVDIN